MTLSALSWDPRRLELEAQPRHRPVLRAAVRRRPLQVQAATAASIRSMPTPGCRPTPSAANWPKAGSWKENPLRVEIKLRKGIMFPEKPGVMAARELVADDVVFSLQPPRQEPEEDHRLFRPRRQGRGHRQAHGGLHLQELQRRVGLSLRLGLLLRHHAEGSRRRRRRQLEERQRHRAVHARPISCRATPTPTSRTRSTGTRRRSTASSTSCRFVDKVVYRTIKDEATFLTALRTGKLDILESDPLAERSTS